MKSFKIDLIFDGKNLLVELPLSDDGYVSMTNNAPLPDKVKTMNPTFQMRMEDFEDDAKIIVPKVLSVDPINEICSNLVVLIQKHMDKYGKLMPADLFSYLNEAVCLLSIISNQIFGQKCDAKTTETYFVIMFQTMWKAFPETMQEFLLKESEFEPMSKYIITSSLNVQLN